MVLLLLRLEGENGNKHFRRYATTELTILWDSFRKIVLRITHGKNNQEKAGRSRNHIE